MSKFSARCFPLQIRLLNERRMRAVSSPVMAIISRSSSTQSSISKLIPIMKKGRNCFVRHYCSSKFPKHVKVLLPALSPTMEVGTVVSWAKEVGDKLSEGDLLCEIETDKATMGFEAPEEGYLAKIFIEQGTKDVPIGKLLCIIVEDETDVKAFDSFSDSDELAKTSETTPSLSSALSSSSPISQGYGSASLMGPAVRLLIHHYGIDENELQRSGPKHNILKEDVMAFVASKNLKPVSLNVSPEATNSSGSAKTQEVTTKPIGSGRRVDSFVDIPLTNIRSTIARRLSLSKKTIPHQYLSAFINSDKMNSIRKELKEKGTRVSVNDFLVKAVALALKAVPEVNVQWINDVPVHQKTVDVSVAVATPSGLITPIVFGADSLGITEISTKIRALVLKAKQNKLQPNEFQGGTFTISNLGMFGSVTNFTAIINTPQAAILAVGGNQSVLTPDLKTENKFQVTLCFDGRAVDENSARQFLCHLSQSLSDPEIMLAQPIANPFDFDYTQLL